LVCALGEESPAAEGGKLQEIGVTGLAVILMSSAGDD
jgi:hypothetical protein